MKRMALTALSLGFAFSACLTNLGFAELPAEHNTFWDNNGNYQVMYDLYDNSLMNIYNLFDKKEYDELDKASKKAISESVKKSLAAGKGEADAYADAYGEQILHLDRIITWKLAGDNPLEGFYELENEAMAGYLGIFFDKDRNLFDMSIYVWSKAEPGKLGRCYARTAELKEKFTTSGVQDPQNIEYDADPKIQIEAYFEDGTATLKTTDAFRKGTYLFGGMGEDITKCDLVIDGRYVLRKN